MSGRFAARTRPSSRVSTWEDNTGGLVFAYPQSSQSASAVATADASSHVMGAWVELVASSSRTTDYMLVSVQNATSNADTRTLLDIGIGAAGSEQVLIASIGAGQSSDAAAARMNWLIPVRIFSGTRIAARIQSFAASRQATVTVSTMTSNVASPTSVDTIGADTSNSRGTNLPTSNTYVEFSSATSKAYSAILLQPVGGTGTAYAAETSSYTLAVGAAGSEIDLMTSVCATTSSETIGVRGYEFVPLYVGFIPAGSRIAVKQSVGRNYRDAILFGVPA